MSASAPFWFKQRQCKTESVAPDTLKVTGPNLAEAFLHVAKGESGHYRASLRTSATGPDVATSETEYVDPARAWDVAYELYRTHVIV